MTGKHSSQSPLVSVCVQTYQHAKFIRQCLDGILMQKTDFPIEILLRDDASTDGTTEIVKEYANKYQNIIKPLVYKENQFVKGVKPFADNVKRTKGKYIAICEGDDYWTDPYKLQKQVDFLEENKDFTITFHNVARKKNENIKHQKLTVESVTDIYALSKENYIPTLSCVYRNNHIIIPDIFLNLSVGDYPIHLLNAKYGKIKFFNEEMGVYRIHDGGVLSTKPYLIEINKLNYLTAFIESNLFDDKSNKIFIERLINISMNLLKNDIDSKYIEISTNTLLKYYNKVELMPLLEIIKGKNYQIRSLYNSKSYRLGNSIIHPLKKLLYLFR